MGQLIGYRGKTPDTAAAAFVAPGVRLIGDVALGEGASVWYNAVARGDVNFIRVGRYSNIQDNSTVHCDSGRSGVADGGLATVVGDYVTVGHGCILHACTIEDECLIGMGAVLLDGARIGRGSIVAAGAVVTKGTVVPPFSVVAGTPAKVIKTLAEESVAERRDQAMHYHRLALENREEQNERR